MDKEIETNRLTPEQLRQVGELLFGNQWQTDLARAINVDSRRIRQWLSGQRKIPFGIKAELVVLLKQKSLDIANYAEVLSSSVE